jgi:ribosomal protein S18 acetylase RimI-like enzyme
MLMAGTDDILIGKLKNDRQARACARLMAASEPWITLRRDEASAMRNLHHPAAEVFVAEEKDTVLGFIVLTMQGPFRGYIATVGVVPERRGQGLGTKLVRFAEERILREVPNVFLLVSSFNTRAQDFYRRLGYELIGQIRDFIVPGHSEILMRKTIAPLTEFRRPDADPPDRKKAR